MYLCNSDIWIPCCNKEYECLQVIVNMNPCKYNSDYYFSLIQLGRHYEGSVSVTAGWSRVPGKALWRQCVCHCRMKPCPREDTVKEVCLSLQQEAVSQGRYCEGRYCVAIIGYIYYITNIANILYCDCIASTHISQTVVQRATNYGAGCQVSPAVWGSKWLKPSSGVRDVGC